MTTVLYQPRRGHRCQHLKRWVTSDDNPYAVPADLADRYVRHSLGSIVGGAVPAAAGGDGTVRGEYVEGDLVIGTDGQVPTAVNVNGENFTPATLDPRDMTKAELAAALGGINPAHHTKDRLVDMYLETYAS